MARQAARQAGRQSRSFSHRHSISSQLTRNCALTNEEEEKRADACAHLKLFRLGICLRAFWLCLSVLPPKALSIHDLVAGLPADLNRSCLSIDAVLLQAIGCSHLFWRVGETNREC